MRQKTFFAFLFSSLFTGTAFAEPGHVTWVTPDFFIEQQSTAEAEQLRTDSQDGNCKAVIRKVICLVGTNSRQCQPGSEAYAEVFETLYDNLPESLQKMFCSMRNLYVEKEFYGTAYAGLVYDALGRTKGVKMGIRKSVLDQRLGLSHWASWKEQLSFGGNPADTYTLTDGLPTIETHTDVPVYDLLYVIVAHEFGHMFDFGNHINNAAIEHADHSAQLSPWSKLSWKWGEQPLPEQDFRGRDGLCFYECHGNSLETSQVLGLYDGLYASNFITSYAATNPWDDFAESFAFYVVDKMLQMQYTVNSQQDKSYDMIQKLHSDVFAAKYHFVEQLIQRSDLRYP